MNAGDGTQGCGQTKWREVGVERGERGGGGERRYRRGVPGGDRMGTRGTKDSKAIIMRGENEKADEVQYKKESKYSCRLDGVHLMH